MESVSVLIVLVALAGFIVPIVLMTRKRVNKEKKIVQSLLNFAANNNSKISEIDCWNTTAIGIDKETHNLFFLKKNGKNEMVKGINLLEIQKCRIINSKRNTGDKDSSQYVIDRIELVFTNRNQKGPEIMLEFYNCDYDGFRLSGESQLIEKWSRIVNTELRSITQIL
jgi:hypothetical protein